MIDKLTIKNVNGEILNIIDGASKFSAEDIESNYHEITAKLIEKSLTVTTMESCTSGLIASLITDCEGASASFKGGFVTYSNEAKILNGVDKNIIDKYGVYSFETAKAMAKSCKDFYSIGILLGDKNFMYKAEIIGVATRKEWKLAVAKGVATVLIKIIN